MEKAYDFYNKKCRELGWEDFGDFLGRMTTDNIRSCVVIWTEEYAKEYADNKN